MPSQAYSRSSLPRGSPAASTTTTSTSSQPRSLDQQQTIDLPPSATLRLRGQTDVQESPQAPRHIQWAENVVDNEGMGKKSSKGASSQADHGVLSAKIAVGLLANPALQCAAFTTSLANWESRLRKTIHPPAHLRMTRMKVITTPVELGQVGDFGVSSSSSSSRKGASLMIVGTNARGKARNA